MSETARISSKRASKHLDPAQPRIRSPVHQLQLEAARQSEAPAENEFSFDTKKDIADRFLCLAALPTFALRLPHLTKLARITAKSNLSRKLKTMEC